MIELSEPKIYEFEEFRLDGRSHCLFRRETGELVPLTPKAIELLLVLVERPGQVLSKDELLDKVWGKSFVEEANLSQTIFVLRKTLGENTKQPRFILTSPNRGYQFIGSVRSFMTDDAVLGADFLPEAQPVAAPIDHPEPVRPKRLRLVWLGVPLALLLALGAYWFYPKAKPATLKEIRSIAILPFKDSSTEQNETYLGASLADALVNKFSGLKRITVRPTRTVAKYADSRDDASKIGRELQVDAVLDGRIQRVGERLRVSVQLIRTSDNATIWSENFDDDFTNFFAVQDSISQKVVTSLAVQLDDSEREKFNRRGTENVAAYQEFLRGRFFWNKRTADGLHEAIEYFQKAVELDPSFAEGYSALAETYVLVNLFGSKHDPNAFPLAKAAAEKALLLNPSLAEAHAALAQVKMQYDFDWAGTESEYLKAVELNPNNAVVRQWYGEFLALQGRPAEGKVQVQMAIDLDPTSLSANNALALVLIKANELDQALAVTAKVLEMEPNFPWALHYRCRAFVLKGQLEPGIEVCRQALAASNQSIFMKANLAHVLAKAGQENGARRILTELEQTARTAYVSPYNFAMIHIAIGDKPATLRYLNQAVDEHDFLIPSLKTDTFFLGLHGDPQFTNILRRVNL
ncbi:MAG: tetratricopeptide repeat protein [Pyrinomonadaceae bacterium]